MAGIYQSVTELIGRTPLLEVKNLEKELNLQARVLVKLEYFNPAGSVFKCSTCPRSVPVFPGIHPPASLTFSVPEMY